MTYSTFTVPVAGGDLLAGRWEGRPGAPVVLAAHGITANHLSWPLVVEALDGAVTVVAPDLRGRGGSNALPGPYCMAAHAADLVAVLDHLGVGKAVVAGHSMGGFVAVVMAHLYPDRVEQLILIDGGIPLPLPESVDVDAVLQAVIGPAMTRLSMTFPTRQAYRDFWRPHPALADWWSPVVEAYVDYDIGGAEPELRSRVSIDAVRGDGADTLLTTTVADAFTGLKHPTVWLRAPRGLMNEEPGLYPYAVAADIVANSPMLTDVLVPDVNHYTIALAPHGAAILAEHIRAAASAR